MNIYNPPTAIHAKAVDLASEGDRIWFEQNPDRQHRLRDVIPFENDGPIELPPYGMIWKVLVTQIKIGTRFRMLIVMPENLANEVVDDKQLAEIFKKVAPPWVKKILSEPRRHRNHCASGNMAWCNLESATAAAPISRIITRQDPCPTRTGPRHLETTHQTTRFIGPGGGAGGRG
jgi:hypothetical protein